MASNKLNQFYSNVFATGIVRPNRFEVFIFPPIGGGYSSLNSPSLLRHLSLVCESVEIPAQTISTMESRINGFPVIPLPYHLSYSNQLNLSFKLSEDYRERNMLLLWQDMIYSPGKGFSYYNEYVGSVIVRPMSPSNEVKQEFIFRNCFPVTIQELGFNWGSSNESLKQGVTFSFFSMETRAVSDSNTSAPLMWAGDNSPSISNMVNNVAGQGLNRIFNA